MHYLSICQAGSPYAKRGRDPGPTSASTIRFGVSWVDLSDTRMLSTARDPPE